MNVNGPAASSIDTVNQLLQVANAENLKLAEKMVKVNLQMSLGVEAGKGELIDLVA